MSEFMTGGELSGGFDADDMAAGDAVHYWVLYHTHAGDDFHVGVLMDLIDAGVSRSSVYGVLSRSPVFDSLCAKGMYRRVV